MLEQLTDPKPFKILNASAGSGKTYNLVKEYIKLLILDEHQSTRFAQIIAMTFTNMASLEMKNRIIEGLDELSYPEAHGNSSANYANQIAEELGIESKEVHKRARKVLQELLHRYEDFHVLTIDKFNLRLIRSFSRDLNLPADFEVVLNEKLVVEQVVDLLLSNMGSDELVEFTKSAFNFAKRNLDDGESWDFRRKLIEFGETLNKEKDQPFVQKLLAADFSQERYAELNTELAIIDREFCILAKEIYQIYLSSGLVSSNFPNGSNTTNVIEKLGQVDKFESKQFTDTFLKNCTQPAPKGKIFPEDLQQKLIALSDFKKTHAQSYLSKYLFRKDFYNMSMLRYVADAIDTLKKDERIIRISEFNKLISSLVQQEEAPFIYERLGNRFSHFLLDEFQDTSRLQWLNMVPLVHESLSKGHKNLIVGDPKQSIYRFKNGVAEQFVALPRIYNPEKDVKIEGLADYFEEAGELKSLDDNWRSAKEIVQFNNQLFTDLKEHLPTTSLPFYKSVSQHPQSSNSGFVNIHSALLEKDDNTSVLPAILDIIKDAQSDGFKLSSICILAEKNKDANHWAITLKKEGYKIISAESLLLSNDIRVNLILSYLKRRLRPSQESEAKVFAETYFNCEFVEPFEKYRGFLRITTDEEGRTRTNFDNTAFLTQHFGSVNQFFFKHEGLYDLIQQFFGLMKWNELTDPYLHHFADFAYEFEQAKGPDLKGLIDLYEEKKNSLAIQTPASDDAIVIMTIHKSKGLEFPIVIVPSLDFDTKINNNSKFMLEAEKLILRTNLSKNSELESIRSQHEDEENQIFTDKMNLCYVALTRAKNRLYGFNYFKKEGFGSILHGALAKQNHSLLEDGSMLLTVGSRSQHLSQKETHSSFFEPKQINETLWFPDIALKERKMGEVEYSLSEEQNFGNQFHLLMAEATDQDSLSSTLDGLIKNGLIEVNNRTTILNKANAIFDSPDFREIYNGTLEVLNEQSILISEDETKRPDKVLIKENETIVLDFKTGLPKKSDHSQIQSYCTIFKAMGATNVKGYLFYTLKNELIQVS
jgi:ATP-dependent exoDNAse (exonuclease V) beta subunit